MSQMIGNLNQAQQDVKAMDSLLASREKKIASLETAMGERSRQERVATPICTNLYSGLRIQDKKR